MQVLISVNVKPQYKNYTIWGKVIKGLDIIEFISKQGIQGGKNDGRSNINFAIKSVTVTNK